MEAPIGEAFCNLQNGGRLEILPGTIPADVRLRRRVRLRLPVQDVAVGVAEEAPGAARGQTAGHAEADRGNGIDVALESF